MLENSAEFNEKVTPVLATDDAVGVQKKDLNRGPKYWFVAVVNNHSEAKAAESLKRFEVETYVPVQLEDRVVRGKNATVERVLLPAMVFIHCTEEMRKELVNTPYIKRFRVDMTARNGFGTHPMLVIPDRQLESFRLALEHARQEEIRLEEVPFKVGEAVKVKSGELKGMEGNILQLADGQQKIVVALGPLACIKLSIPASKLKHIQI